MKKIVLVMAVLMLAAPAWAVTVDITAVQVGNTDEVEIWYATDGNLPRAFALNITLSEDVNIVACEPAHVGECNETDRGYGIFPGTIDISDGEVVGWGDPYAPGDAPGAEGTGIDTNEIVVEMGSLYTGANTPDTSGLLCTITVSAECTVSIAENETRGGLVMENPAETPAVNFTGCTVTLEPSCWSDPGQALGDADGSGVVNFADLGALKASWFKSTGQEGYNPCADFDRSGTVNFADLGIIKVNWFQTVP